MAQLNTPALPASAVPPSPLSPRELADMIAISGSAQVRAAFACGLASALLPVLAIALQQADMAQGDRMAWLAAVLLLSISLLCGVATFLEKFSLLAASAVEHARKALPAGRSTPGSFSAPPAPLSPRERRALATSVSSHCAATFAVLGAFVACAAWVVR